MSWSVKDTPTKNSILTQVNTSLGTNAKVSWKDNTNAELATTALNSTGAPFSTPSAGSMNLLNASGGTLTAGLLSTVFSGGGCNHADLEKSDNTIVVSGTVATSGADINVDAIPTANQQLRLDSLSLGVV